MVIHIKCRSKITINTSAFSRTLLFVLCEWKVWFDTWTKCYLYWLLCLPGSHPVCRFTPSWMSWMIMLGRGSWWLRRWLSRFTMSWWGTAKTSKPRGNTWVQDEVDPEVPCAAEHQPDVLCFLKIDLPPGDLTHLPSHAFAFYLASLKISVGNDVTMCL